MEFKDIVNPPPTKKQIREELKLKRSLYPQDQKHHDDVIITRTLQSLDLVLQAKAICAYVSMRDEVDTKALLNWLFKRNKSVVVVPKVEGKSLKLYRIFDFKYLKESSFGILEPDNYCQTVDLTYPEIIITPGIAFSEKGYRIGYGSGFYDRLFSQTEAIRIALAYDFQVLEYIPNEDYDKQVDLLITPTRIINCTKKIKL